MLQSNARGAHGRKLKSRLVAKLRQERTRFDASITKHGKPATICELLEWTLSGLKTEIKRGQSITSFRTLEAQKTNLVFGLGL